MPITTADNNEVWSGWLSLAHSSLHFNNYLEKTGYREKLKLNREIQKSLIQY